MKDLVANIAIEYYSRFPELMRDDILHTQEVVCYTRLIAVGENIPTTEVDLLEAAAWMHDIGCPRSKEIYGNSLPENQQRVGKVVADELLADLEVLNKEEKQWIADVVASHHQFSKVEELGFAPLFEADLIVNILSGYHPLNKAQHLYESMMRTQTGKRLFRTLIGVEE
ncbi:MAG: HD domain-containing protein [Rikenellaceae bacterium]